MTPYRWCQQSVELADFGHMTTQTMNLLPIYRCTALENFGCQYVNDTQPVMECLSLRRHMHEMRNETMT